MRTTIDIPEHLMKRAKIIAVKEGISLKELFTRSLEKELKSGSPEEASAPWKKLQNRGSANDLSPDDSGFEEYTGPDRNQDIKVNDPNG